MLDPQEALEGLKKAAVFFGVDGIPEFVSPEERHTLAGRMRIHHLDWGTDGRPPILFAHGTGLTAHTWDLVCLQLRQAYRCLAMDLRGHGESEWSAGMEYGIQHHASDIGNLADVLGLDRFVLVGMSLGGLASTLFASKNADRLAGLAVIDIAPGVGRGRARNPGTQRIGQFIQRQEEHDDVEGFVKEALAFNPRRDPDLLRVSLRHNLRLQADGKWTWKYDRRHHARPAAMGGMATAMQELADGVRGITCPVLLVRGEESDVLDPEGAERFVKELPDGRLAVVEKAGHTVQGDNPSGFTRALRAFLDEVGI